jgi:hypothetical protein
MTSLLLHLAECNQHRTIENASLRPIKVISDLEINRETTWMALGYPFHRNECCEAGKMTKVTGKVKKSTHWVYNGGEFLFTDDHKSTQEKKQSSFGEIRMENSIKGGMSGGPWMLQHSGGSANGNCSCSQASSNYTTSPYYVQH